ncbi:signal peptidase I [Agromyces sp. MMS24-JH15]|uniref:signal peptidase I n=1 Tax=Agromyces sp. MMS24-JH15 TaxID=3243765 RepID=UPI00374A40C1
MPITQLPWPTVVRVALCRAYVALVGTLAVLAVLPQAFLLVGTTVMSDSMAPVIRAGDVALSSPIDPADIEEGQVVLFHDPAADSDADARLMFHRVDEVRADGAFVTKGDANADADSTPVDPSEVVGIGRLLVPLIGLPVVWAADGSWLGVAAFVAVSALALRGMSLPQVPAHREGARSTRRRARGALEVTASALVVALGVLLVFAAAGRGASAAFTSQTATGVSSWSTDAPPVCTITDWQMHSPSGTQAWPDFKVRTIATPIKAPWVLTWRWAGDWRVVGAWNGEIKQSESTDVTYTSADWADLWPDSFQSVGFTVTSESSSWGDIPTDFKLNGQPCTFVPKPPSVPESRGSAPE